MKRIPRLRVGNGLASRIGSLGATAALLTVCATSLGGCSIPIADVPLIGLPANAPPRPETQPAYLPVHDVPPPRDEEVLTVEQQKKLQTDLLSARDKQNAEANALVKSTPTDTPPKAKESTKSSAKSSTKASVSSNTSQQQK